MLLSLVEYLPVLRGIGTQVKSGIKFILCFCLVSIASCVSDEAHRYYASDHYAPRPCTEVEVLRAAPTKEYVVIADFQARGANEKYMQKKAAEIGADAVIVGIFGGFRSKKDDWASEDRESNTYTRITGTAIRYK